MIQLDNLKIFQEKELSEEEKIQALTKTIKIAYGLLPSLVILLLLFYLLGFQGNFILLNSIIIFCFCMTILQHYFIIKKWFIDISYRYAYALVLVGCVTVGTRYTGYIISPFIWLGLFSVLVETISYSPRKGIILSLIYLICFWLILPLDYFGFFSPVNWDSEFNYLDFPQVTLSLLIGYSIVYFILPFALGFLSQKLDIERKEAINFAEEQRKSQSIYLSIMEDLEETKVELEKRMADLNNSRRSTLYLLEDANQARKDLQMAHNLLETKVNERTKELNAANVRLKELDKVKSDFIASMSHELRTPLNSIIGFSEIMYDETFGALNEKQKEYANDVLTSGQHLLSLINDILDISKVEAGKLDLMVSSIMLKDIIDSSILMIKEKAYKHSIEISVNIDESLGLIEGDERKLKQIFFNILSNAAKFTPDGGKISIIAKRIDGQVEVSVSDNGIGLDKKYLETIFEDFMQIDNAYTKKEQGTGLGLSLCRKLVTLHKGEIHAESDGLGLGTTFHLVLPIKQ